MIKYDFPVYIFTNMTLGTLEHQKYQILPKAKRNQGQYSVPFKIYILSVNSIIQASSKS